MSETYEQIIDSFDPEMRARIKASIARIDALIESRKQAKADWDEAMAWFREHLGVSPFAEPDAPAGPGESGE